jgi:hypothetical protein
MRHVSFSHQIMNLSYSVITRQSLCDHSLELSRSSASLWSSQLSAPGVSLLIRKKKLSSTSAPVHGQLFLLRPSQIPLPSCFLCLSPNEHYKNSRNGLHPSVGINSMTMLLRLVTFKRNPGKTNQLLNFKHRWIVLFLGFLVSVSLVLTAANKGPCDGW